MIKCSIINDLLAAYVSGTGSEDTRELVDEHIAACGDCRDKLAEMQERVAAQLREKDAKSINVFKTMKKKIFRRNVLVATVAAVFVLIIALFTGIKIIDYKPIAYYDGLVNLEVHYADYYNGEGNIKITVSDPSKNPETTGKIPVLDISCAQNYYSSNATGRTITRDGEQVHVMYICFLDNILTRIKPANEGQLVHRLVFVDPGLINDSPVRTEVYYFTDVESARNNALSDKEFDDFRHNGTLVWSGYVDDTRAFF